jgi:L,D-peptidoglycan transpeptidase YkuD (ErfK/YbiS/YcfS/YnhG family)
MPVGRAVSSLGATLAVAACAVVAIGMHRAEESPAANPRPAAPVSQSSRPAFLPAPTVSPAAQTTTRIPSPSAAATPVRTMPAAKATTAGPTGSPAVRPRSTAARPAMTTAAARATAAATPVRAALLVRGQSLPLRYSTGTATRVITVVARSTASRTATLQAWTKAAGGGWLKYGSAVTAHVGADGLSTHPSESRSATPIGSFTLTLAFGHYADPGTALPYIHTNPADWWISQAGPLYNTHQRCWSGCRFTRGAPNEHLYYETPFYNYAVVIDYNTRNAPGGVRPGAGSAFFLHVTDGSATAGCVAIGQSKLVSLLRWLTPTAHPRILIGIG